MLLTRIFKPNMCTVRIAKNIKYNQIILQDSYQPFSIPLQYDYRSYSSSRKNKLDIKFPRESYF